MISVPNPGVLDFQDAVYGPITYDVVSLFRDAFISWPEAAGARLDGAVLGARETSRLPVSQDFGEFYRDLEWMGLQRHLKVLGFSRVFTIADGKTGYLEDTPRFVGYARAVAARYAELGSLLKLFDALERRVPSTVYTF